MNQTDFEIVINQTVEEIRRLLIVKGGEYAGSTDRLANFKRGAELVGVSPLQCLFIYLSKHYDAISTFVRDDAAGLVRPRSEPIDGRLDDLINYAILAKALVKEQEKARANKVLVSHRNDTVHRTGIRGSDADASVCVPDVPTSDEPA